MVKVRILTGTIVAAGREFGFVTVAETIRRAVLGKGAERHVD